MTAGDARRGGVAEALRVPRLRRIALGVTAAYLVVYLFAIGNLVVSPATDLARSVPIPSAQVVPDWTSKAFKQIAPFSYEPVVTIYPANHVTILVSPLNIAMGLALGGLVGINVALALRISAMARACRTRAFGGLLGAIPGLLTGFACCVPTVALVLGAQFAVALIALRSFFFPVALAALLGSLAWNARRARRLAATA
jgi:hypothetical protein